MLVVGAAILHHHRLLAARRSGPPALAGRWELPGGKVEAGESVEDAAVREVVEELGCTIRVTGALRGRTAVRPGLDLVVVLAELVEGEPVPHEHDAVRWVGPDDLRALAWLAPDLPFLDALEDAMRNDERCGPRSARA